MLNRLDSSCPSNVRKSLNNRPLRLHIEWLEDRTALNGAWGNDGPPLLANTSSAAAVAVRLNAGDASGTASISRSEIDYYRFTPAASGFFRLKATGNFDAMVAVYTAGTSGQLLGYSDTTYSGTEQFTAYLEAGKTYYLGVSNYRYTYGGTYQWVVDDVDTAGPGAPDTKRTLYLNFDSANLAASALRTWDDHWQYGSAAEFDPKGDGVQVGKFLASHADREVIINGILNHLQQDLSAFGVRVARLAAGSSAVSGVGVTTIFVGPSTLEDLAETDPNRSLFHVAGDIDVGNNNGTDVAFVADEDWGSASTTALTLADVVLHEAGHTFGLFHVESGSAVETMGLRYSTPESGWVRNSGFLNRSFYHRDMYGSQDSYQSIARAFGVGGALPSSTSVVGTANTRWRSEERALYHGDHDHEHGAEHGHEERPAKVGAPLPGFSEEDLWNLLAARKSEPSSPALARHDADVVLGMPSVRRPERVAVNRASAADQAFARAVERDTPDLLWDVTALRF